MADILAVDDDERVLRAVRRMLERAGHRVIAFTSGPAALDHEAQPDVALLDIQMPGMDGPEVARRLRVRWPELPVVFMTGGATESQMAEATALGPVLEKPPEARELVRVVGEVARLRGVGGPS
ncbi:MAG: response regulator [bacterium]